MSDTSSIDLLADIVSKEKPIPPINFGLDYEEELLIQVLSKAIDCIDTYRIRRLINLSNEDKVLFDLQCQISMYIYCKRTGTHISEPRYT